MVRASHRTKTSAAGNRGPRIRAIAGSVWLAPASRCARESRARAPSPAAAFGTLARGAQPGQGDLDEPADCGLGR